MKDDPSPMMRQVHAMKRAVQEETKHLTTAKEYFEYIHKMIPDLGLPTARRVARGSRGRTASGPKAWRRGER